MEVNDYVRTEISSLNLQRIGKIKEIISEYFIHTDIGTYDKENIIKSSPNIIDLIEERDIVVIINGLNEEELILIKDLKREKPILESHKIKSIVTKEQFESMEYKVEEK